FHFDLTQHAQSLGDRSGYIGPHSHDTRVVVRDDDLVRLKDAQTPPTGDDKPVAVDGDVRGNAGGRLPTVEVTINRVTHLVAYIELDLAGVALHPQPSAHATHTGPIPVRFHGQLFDIRGKRILR